MWPKNSKKKWVARFIAFFLLITGGPMTPDLAEKLDDEHEDI